MRLPADATLIVVGDSGGAGRGDAAAKVAALKAAWRREELPALDIGAGGFAGGRLEASLDDLGATTLVLCGEQGAVEAAARDAAALGFHAFLVRDACWRAAGAPQDAFAPRPEDGGAVVDAAATLAAAALAKARQRREARRPR